MKIVYIAGPYGDAGGYLAIDDNINQARKAADWLVSNGVGYICPHMNSAHFEAIRPEIPVDFWYEMDLRLMAVADAMLVLPFWEKSKGTKREIAEFESTGKPVFYMTEYTDRLLPWALGQGVSA